MICLQSPGGRAEINNFETAHFNGAPFFNMVYMMNGFAFAKKEFIGSGVKSGRRCFLRLI